MILTRTAAVSCPRIVQFIITFSNETGSVSGDLATFFFFIKTTYDFLIIFTLTIYKHCLSAHKMPEYFISIFTPRSIKLEQFSTHHNQHSLLQQKTYHILKISTFTHYVFDPSFPYLLLKLYHISTNHHASPILFSPCSRHLQPSFGHSGRKRTPTWKWPTSGLQQ